MTRWLASLFLLLSTAVALAQVAPAVSAPKHEMRGAWLATVFGIDWPTKTGTSRDIVNLQKRELCQILDSLEHAGLNAVFFQVRPMADALYHSKLEPFSEFVSGERGKDPGWDPLQYAIEQAHSRGLELHAWINPFRLSKTLPLPSTPADRRYVDQGWVITYAPNAKKASASKKKKGRKSAKAAKTTEAQSILDPGNPAARAHIVEVCRDIATRYDIDGMVFDDYFYPDRLPEGNGYDFLEYGQWLRERPQTHLSQADWRRQNVNTAIAEVSAMLRQVKPWLRFGVSPAGVAGGNGEASSRYGLPKPSVGSDWMYGRIYCDPLAWMEQGTVDYVSPQLYWPTDHATNPFTPLALWWSGASQRLGGVPVYPSQYLISADDRSDQPAQIADVRRFSPSSQTGSVLYSCAFLSGKKAKDGLASQLNAGPYRHKALMPPLRRLLNDKDELGNAFDLHTPHITGLKRRANQLTWKALPDMRYIVYALPDRLDTFDALSHDGANFAPEYILGITYDPHFAIPTPYRRGFRFAVAPYTRSARELPPTFL